METKGLLLKQKETLKRFIPDTDGDWTSVVGAADCCTVGDWALLVSKFVGEAGGALWYDGEPPSAEVGVGLGGMGEIGNPVVWAAEIGRAVTEGDASTVALSVGAESVAECKKNV